MRKGHTPLTNLVAAGEVPLALTVYISSAEQAKRKGAPLDWFVIPPRDGATERRGRSRAMRRIRYAAVLFFDFLISDGQTILASRQFVPASRNIETPFKGPLQLIDSAVMLDHARKWQELFQKTIISPSR